MNTADGRKQPYFASYHIYSKAPYTSLHLPIYNEPWRSQKSVSDQYVPPDTVQTILLHMCFLVLFQ